MMGCTETPRLKQLLLSRIWSFLRTFDPLKERADTGETESVSGAIGPKELK